MGSVTSPIQTSCKICGDREWIPITREDGSEAFARCSCYKVKRAKRMWKKSGFDADNREKTFKTFKDVNPIAKQAKITAYQYVKNFSDIAKDRVNSLLFMGQVGSGKTHLCIAASLNLLEKGIPVLYMSYRDTITSLKQNMLDELEYQKQVNLYKTVEVLFIDDLFKGKITESDINIMFEIINYRYLNRLPIIVSTEYTLDQLLDKDEATASRIYEMSKKYSCEIMGRENNFRLR